MKKKLTLLVLTGVMALAACSQLPLPARIGPAIKSAPVVITLPADAPVPAPHVPPNVRGVASSWASVHDDTGAQR